MKFVISRNNKGQYSFAFDLEGEKTAGDGFVHQGDCEEAVASLKAKFAAAAIELPPNPDETAAAPVTKTTAAKKTGKKKK